MIYVKLNPDQSMVYPYSIQQLKKDNPNTSFPEEITESILLDYDVYNVISVEKGTDYTKNYIETDPILVGNEYYQNWNVVNATPEEINQRITDQWATVRITRNHYLQQCDWTQLPDSPLSPEMKNEWVIYRQQLRDITEQPDPFNIIWPTEPS